MIQYLQIEDGVQEAGNEKEIQMRASIRSKKDSFFKVENNTVCLCSDRNN